MNEFETDYVFDGDGRPVEELRGGRKVSVPNPPPMNVQPMKYQVWSSVLGASVATLLPDGTPQTRNVFAGKAVIAELGGTGMNTYDGVTWKTSDPASGTVVSYTNDGTANTGYVSEQNEPLGQSISLEPPPFQGEVYDCQSHLFTANDEVCHEGTKARREECGEVCHEGTGARREERRSLPRRH